MPSSTSIPKTAYEQSWDRMEPMTRAFVEISREKGVNMSNDNPIPGWKCPKCLSEGPFWADATFEATILVSKNGILEKKDEIGPVFDRYGAVTCKACGFKSAVKHFW